MKIQNRVKRVICFTLFITCLLITMFYYGKAQNTQYMISGYISAYAFYMMATKNREDEQNESIH